MSDIETGSESGAQTEGSSSPETASPAQSQQEAVSQEGSQQVTQKESPFHEHPRFKELVEQKNQYAEKYSNIEKAYQQMQAQMQQLQQQYKTQSVSSKPNHEQLLARLEQIDPEFAGYQKEVFEKANMTEQLQQEMQELKEWKQSYQAQRDAEAATSKLEKLYSDHKIADNLKPFYKEAIANMAYVTPNARVSDLEQFFKQAHERLSKTFDDIKRSERESYVSQKKSDSRPATQTGGTAPGVGKGTGNQSLDDVKQALAKAIRSNSNI